MHSKLQRHWQRKQMEGVQTQQNENQVLLRKVKKEKKCFDNHHQLALHYIHLKDFHKIYSNSTSSSSTTRNIISIFSSSTQGFTFTSKCFVCSYKTKTHHTVSPFTPYIVRLSITWTHNLNTQTEIGIKKSWELRRVKQNLQLTFIPLYY